MIILKWLLVISYSNINFGECDLAIFVESITEKSERANRCGRKQLDSYVSLGKARTFLLVDLREFFCRFGVGRTKKNLKMTS